MFEKSATFCCVCLLRTQRRVLWLHQLQPINKARSCIGQGIPQRVPRGRHRKAAAPAWPPTESAQDKCLRNLTAITRSQIKRNTQLSLSLSLSYTDRLTVCFRVPNGKEEMGASARKCGLSLLLTLSHAVNDMRLPSIYYLRVCQPTRPYLSSLSIPGPLCRSWVSSAFLASGFQRLDPCLSARERWTQASLGTPWITCSLLHLSALLFE